MARVAIGSSSLKDEDINNLMDATFRDGSTIRSTW